MHGLVAVLRREQLADPAVDRAGDDVLAQVDRGRVVGQRLRTRGEGARLASVVDVRANRTALHLALADVAPDPPAQQVEPLRWRRPGPFELRDPDHPAGTPAPPHGAQRGNHSWPCSLHAAAATAASRRRSR
jgi:hypothetical protein